MLIVEWINTYNDPKDNSEKKKSLSNYVKRMGNYVISLYLLPISFVLVKYETDNEKVILNIQNR